MNMKRVFDYKRLFGFFLYGQNLSCHEYLGLRGPSRSLTAPIFLEIARYSSKNLLVRTKKSSVWARNTKTQTASKVFLLIGLSSILSTPILGASFYVSPNGQNGQQGSLQAPLFLIQEAIDRCQSGLDTIWLMPGTYWQSVTLVNKKGVYLSSLDASDPATISGSGVTGLHIIYIQDSDSIHLANLILREKYEQEANAVYVVGEGDGIFISDNEIFNVGWGNDPSQDPESFNPVRQAHGILINGRTEQGYQNIYLGRNHFHDLVVGNSEAITLTGNVFNFLIEENHLERVSNIGIDIAGHYTWAFPDSLNPSLNQARAGRIRANLITDCRRPTAGNEPAAIYVDGGKDVIIDQNELHHNGIGVSIGCENLLGQASHVIVANNLIYQQEKFGMVFGANVGQVKQSVVRNNTFFDNGIIPDNSGALALQKSEEGVIRNNLIYLTSDQYFGLSLFGFEVQNLAIDHNLFFSTAGNTPRVYAFNPAGGSTYQSEAIQFIDPKFASTDSLEPDFHLQEGSPAIDRGSNQISLIPQEVDLDGQARSLAQIDIGADEFQTATSRSAMTQHNPQVYPNPSKGWVIIRGLGHGAIHFRLMDTQGRILHESSSPGPSVQLDLTTLAPGLYFVETVHAMGRSLSRVIRAGD